MSDATDATAVPGRDGWIWLPPAASLLMLLFGAWAATALANGRFGYPLDDVLIHLSIADQIARGHYGVQAGSVSAAASSILWPVLLAPFAGSRIEIYAPLILNAIALATWSGLFASLLRRAGYRGLGWGVIAVLGPLVLYPVGLALMGMEHAAQAAAALAILIGIIDMAEQRRVPAMLTAAVLLGPAFRYEMMAPALIAAAAATRLVGWRAGLKLAALALAPPVLFAGFLTYLGLAPVPASILAKQTLPTGLQAVVGALAYRVPVPARHLLQVALAPAIALAVAATVPTTTRRTAAWWVVALAFGATWAQFAYGGASALTMRYSGYVLAMDGAALAWMLGPAGGAPSAHSLLGGPVRWWVLGIAGISSALLILPLTLKVGIFGPLSIDVQQRQMAHFAKDYVKGPVAVNDLGWVAWRNPNQALDLWGLASPKARRMRNGAAPPGWPERMSRDAGVQLAMVYDTWLDPFRAPSSSWTRIGDLRTLVPRGALGGKVVSFYAVHPDDAPRLRRLAADWARTLPSGAQWVPAPAEGGS